METIDNTTTKLFNEPLSTSRLSIAKCHIRLLVLSKFKEEIYFYSDKF